MSSEESITGLFSHLCELKLQTKRANLIQPRHDKTYWRRRLHKKLYDTLFGYLKRPRSCSKLAQKTQGMGSEFIDILSFVYLLRTQRKFDEATRLEQIVEILMPSKPSDEKFNADEEMKNILRLFICLSGTAPELEETFLGHGEQKLPILQQKKSEMTLLPNGPLIYGDTQLFSPEHSCQYMHFPNDLFEKKSLTSGEIPISIFQLTPGQSLSGNGLFNVKGYLNDMHERDTCSSLFGALSQSKVTSLDVKLDIPELSDMDSRFCELSITKSTSYSQVSEDEGFIETDISPSTTSISTFDDSAIEEDIWVKALSYKPSKHYTWENIGSEPGPTSRPYFSEAGPCALDEWYNMRLQELSILCPFIRFPQRPCISQKELVEDIKNLLIGVSSYTFVLNLEEQSFSLLPGTCMYVSGTTPEALESFLQDFINCGANYYRLKMFSKTAALNSFYKAGLVFQAFTEAVQKHLQHYRAMILSIDSDVSFIELRFICQKLFAQMRYLSKLCHCQKRLIDEQQPENGFPVGIPLLSYLYEETLEGCNTENYPMLLAILKTTLRPYTLFVQNWVFHGVHRDSYEEFMIDVNDNYLESRGRHYWSHGYMLKTADIGSSVPSFLSDMASDIFTCGKSVNLLRICCPEHFICRINDSDIPRVMITFSERALHQLGEQCRIYVGKIQQVAKQLTISRRQMQQRTERAKQDLMRKAKQVATEAHNRLQAKIDQLKKAEDAKKRKVFKFLKEQMETDLQRRANEKQAEKEGDKAYMELVARKEGILAKEESELEKKAREEVIQFYEKLSEEAVFREQKSLWKVRRAKLHVARMNFLSKEEGQITAEMKIFEEKRAEEARQNLPNWARNVTEESETVVVPGQELSEGLPAWASKGLSLNPDSDLDSVPGSVLPQWARTDMVKYDDKDIPLVVSAEDSEAFPFISSVESNTLAPKPTVESSVQFSGQITNVQDFSTDVHDTPADFSENKMSSTVVLETKPTAKTEMASVDYDIKETLSDIALPKVNRNDQEETKPVAGIKTASVISDVINSTAVTKTQSEQDHVSKQTEEKGERSHVKMSVVTCSTAESECQVEDKPHIKSVQNKHISQQTESDDSIKPLIKMNDERYASKETTQSNKELVFGKKMGDKHVTQQSESTEWKIKKQSFFGHVSQLSNQDYVFSAPRLKHNKDMFATKESEYSDFPHRPKIKMNEAMSSTKESQYDTGPIITKPHIKMSRTMHSTMESEAVDHEANICKKFLERNVHGHASQSTIQKLLYGEKLEEIKKTESNKDATKLTEIAVAEETTPIWLDEVAAESYMDNFDFLNDTPVVDLMMGIVSSSYDGIGDLELRASEIDAFKYVSLPVLLQKSVTMPLVAQISLVNECVINYFTVDLQIEMQFKALRRYLLMADGDFSQNVSDMLMEKLSTKPRPHQLLNPVFLNSTLTKALQSSMHVDDKYTHNLSFAVRYLPKVLNLMEHDTLDCLELRFRTEWPVNIIITEEAIDKYGKVFSFMLQLKRIVWVLKDVWYRLKRDALIHGAGHDPEFRQLHLYRQEMQHFVKVMQGYIANQIIHVTWQEFKEALNQDVHNLDDLYRVHMDYLNKAFFRCLLTKNATPVMKIIQDIFCRILKFHAQLVSSDWFRDARTGKMSHNNFTSMVSSYKAFKKFSSFLFKIVNKLAIRGYQPHLQELLLRLNFNEYYKDS